ncbi:MAG: TadE/TadG family type IV pilus assembly protein [Sphingobium sp.]
MRRRILKRVAGDERGATLLEFALVAPIMLLLILGLGELTYEIYVKAVLTGSMQKAGRDSAIETANTTTIDDRVLAQVRSVAPSAQMIDNSGGKPRRSSYATFGYIQPEPYTDTNRNNVRDSGECFTDYNGNGVWDADPGISGQGGASDYVVYTVTISYRRLFPLVFMGMSNLATTTASTIIKNQPYSNQVVPTPATVCT